MDTLKMSSVSMKENADMKNVGENCIECDICTADHDDQTTQLPTASKRCLECEQNLCDQCLKDHNRQKLLKNHQIEDIPCQIDKHASRSNQSRADNIVEEIPGKDLDSANASSGCLSTTHAQHQHNGIDIMVQISRERDRLKKYETEMSGHINELVKVQEDINTKAENFTRMIINKHSECVARLDGDKKCLLDQLDLRKKAIISDNEIKLEETISYLKKIKDHRVNFEEILNKGSIDAKDESTKSLLLHVHFQRPAQSLDNVSFCKSSFSTGTENILGRLEGFVNISKTQTVPTLSIYKTFLFEVHRRAKDANEIHWKMTIPNEIEMKNLCDSKSFERVINELQLSRADRKWVELQAKHGRIVSLLNKVTRPTSESSSEKLESHLTELQHNIGKLWNMIEFQIHYKNSEKGLIPEVFPNYGNTSYFNAVLQCLLQTVLLPFELTLNIYGLENVLTEKMELYPLSRAFMELASNYNKPGQRQGSLWTLYSMFNSSTQRFDDQGQHDSHVLLIHILDKLRVEERNSWKIPSADPKIKNMPTAVDQIFGGQFITVYTCLNCEELYAIREPFLDISIPLCALAPDEQKSEENRSKPTTPSGFEMIDAHDSVTPRNYRNDGQLASATPDVGPKQSQPVCVGKNTETQSRCEMDSSSSSAIDDARKDFSAKEIVKKMLQPINVKTSAEPETKNFLSRMLTSSNLTVSQCLTYFTRAEFINNEYLCRNCQESGCSQPTMTSATKRTLISSPPAVLVLHLKRFEQKSKRDEMIAYDELLDLGPFCSSSALRIDPEVENVWYSLYAVVVHSGSFLFRGHYVAYVKQRDASAQLEDPLREKFLQKNFGDREKVPNNDDLAALEKRKAIRKREKAQRPIPIPGKWFCISDDTVRLCDAKVALDQKAFLLFYERIPGTDHKTTSV